MNRREFLQLNGTVAGLACLPKLSTDKAALRRVLFTTPHKFVVPNGTRVGSEDGRFWFKVIKPLPTYVPTASNWLLKPQGALVEAEGLDPGYRTCPITRVDLSKADASWPWIVLVHELYEDEHCIRDYGPTEQPLLAIVA